MIVLSNNDVAKLLPMARAIDVVGDAMVEVSAGKTTLPLRNIMPIADNNFMGMMPGAMENPDSFGIKLVSLYPDNPAHGYSSHQGAMILFEAKHGSAIAMMNAGLLTAIRTAAASAVATRELARTNATSLTMIGYGEQALHHLDAMLAVRAIENVTICGRSLEKAGNFVEAAQAKFPDVKFTANASIQDAVENADIVCTVTASSEPVLFGKWVAPGCHLNIVGASIPSKREIDTDLVVRSSLFVDYRASTFAQAGEVILAIEDGQIDANHVRAEIGEVISGNRPGRADNNEITLYRSLGVAAQDIAVAHDVYLRAQIAGLGTEVSID